MINNAGDFYMATLRSLGLVGQQVTTATANASSIINKIVTAYNNDVGEGHVGEHGNGIPNSFRKRTLGPNGLIYGRIQSGKTRAMITSTAMAFDNGFRLALVMTSNNNDLVNQTHLDFIKHLVGVSAFTKDDELDDFIEHAQVDLSTPEGRIVIITSKGDKSLANVLHFLESIDAQKYPLLIFDDEGDQASLDTNTYKRSKTGDLTLEKSTINKLIFKIRSAFPACVYVAVTGTPQAVLLQTASSDNKPSFIEMLPPGIGYIGGNYFFETSEPQENEYNLISIVPNLDKSRLLRASGRFPEGLRDAILFFLLSASAAKLNKGLPSDGKGYQFLCHPSLRNDEQARAKGRILSYLTAIKRVLIGEEDTLDILAALNTQYRALQMQLGRNETPALPVLKSTIKEILLRPSILVINAANNNRTGIEYRPGFNFLIGGNTLGRGIAIPNLLVTYYVRHSKVSQMDTMHQHARMFGYREDTLAYTKLFTTFPLYYRFCDIFSSDEALRGFIEQHVDDPKTFPIDTSIGLNPTRKGVLDAENVVAVVAGMQVYPNRMKLPQTARSIHTIWDLLFNAFNISDQDLVKLKTVGKEGVLISLSEAYQMLEIIKTRAQNTWNDRTIQTVLDKLYQRLGSRIRLKYRSADRTVLEDGSISSGTLSGKEQNDARLDEHTTLWIMDVTPKPFADAEKMPPFFFPTIVVPNKLPRVFIFTKA
jgi:hypothetical protein